MDDTPLVSPSPPHPHPLICGERVEKGEEEAGAVILIHGLTDGMYQGFGVTARSTAEARKLEPTGIVCFRQADVGEYLREVSFPKEKAAKHERVGSFAADRLVGRRILFSRRRSDIGGVHRHATRRKIRQGTMAASKDLQAPRLDIMLSIKDGRLPTEIGETALIEEPAIEGMDLSEEGRA